MMIGHAGFLPPEKTLSVGVDAILQRLVAMDELLKVVEPLYPVPDLFQQGVLV